MEQSQLELTNFIQSVWKLAKNWKKEPNVGPINRMNEICQNWRFESVQIQLERLKFRVFIGGNEFWKRKKPIQLILIATFCSELEKLGVSIGGCNLKRNWNGIIGWDLVLNWLTLSCVGSKWLNSINFWLMRCKFNENGWKTGRIVLEIGDNGQKFGGELRNLVEILLNLLN